jgi:hypothetical protein
MNTKLKAASRLWRNSMDVTTMKQFGKAAFSVAFVLRLYHDNRRDMPVGSIKVFRGFPWSQSKC